MDKELHRWKKGMEKYNFAFRLAEIQNKRSNQERDERELTEVIICEKDMCSINLSMKSIYLMIWNLGETMSNLWLWELDTSYRWKRWGKTWELSGAPGGPWGAAPGAFAVPMGSLPHRPHAWWILWKCTKKVHARACEMQTMFVVWLTVSHRCRVPCSERYSG